jgi:hypothetical protein
MSKTAADEILVVSDAPAKGDDQVVLETTTTVTDGTQSATDGAEGTQDENLEIDPADVADTKAWQGKAEKRLKELRAIRGQRDGFKTEAETLKAQIADLTPKAERAATIDTILSEKDAKIRDKGLELAFFRLGSEIKFSDADLAFTNLDRSALTFDEAGAVTNLRAVVDALTTAHPRLLADEPIVPVVDSGAAGNPGRTPSTPVDLKNVTTEQYLSNPTAYQAAMTANGGRK